MEEVILGFQEEYPWIVVTHRGIDNEIWEETLRSGLYSEDPPDIFITESRAELLEYVDAGLVYDLTEWYAQYQQRFIPGYELNSVIRGRRYAIPWDIQVLDLIWYNTQIMEKYDLDPTTITTWDKLAAMCESLKQHGEIPFAFGGGGAGWTGGHWVMFLLQKHLSPEDIMKLARREKHWTDPDVVAALSHFEEFVNKGYFAPDAAKNDPNIGQELYFQGQGAFWQAGSWHLFQKGGGIAPPDWNFQFIPFPNFPGAPVQNVAISTSGTQWTVHDKSKHLDEALLFLKYMTRRTPAAELWVKEVHWFLVIREAVNEHTASPEMVAISRYLEAANVTTALESYLPRQVVQDGHWKGSLAVLSGQMTTEEWAELIEELHKASGTLMLE
jgi:raffinose/stachyose/melibiose transport system substrate-binding protein